MNLSHCVSENQILPVDEVVRTKPATQIQKDRCPGQATVQRNGMSWSSRHHRRFNDSTMLSRKSHKHSNWCLSVCCCFFCYVHDFSC